MNSKTRTKGHLTAVIYKKTGHTHVESKELVESILNLMKQAIKKDGTLLVSGFGKFDACDKKARRGRNPKTTESLTILPRKVVVFRLSGKFRGELNPQESA